MKRVYACIGGGSNAVGIFQGFMDTEVELVGVEAGGKGRDRGEHASRIASGQGSVGIAGEEVSKHFFCKQKKDNY